MFMNTKVNIKIGNKTMKAVQINNEMVKTKRFSFLKMRFIETYYFLNGVLKTAEIV